MTEQLSHLPPVNGRPPRIALVVYNQVSTDSRVLKTAQALHDGGAQVLIVGTARPPRHPAGEDVTATGEAIIRVPDFDLASLLPWLAKPIRARRNARAREEATRLATQARPASTDEVGAPAPDPSDAAGSPAPPAEVTAPPLRVPLIFTDIWLKLFQVVRLAWFGLGVTRQLRRWRPDVIHANDGNTLPAALATRLLTRSRIVYDAHELWTDRNIRRDRLIAPAVESLIERAGVRAASGVVTVSPSIVTWMQRRFRLKTPPTLVRNIPHRTSAVPDRGNGRMRELAGLPAESKVVAYCGGVTTGRGLEETIAALALLPQDAHLVMLGYGDPHYVASLFAAADEHGLRKRVHLVGPVPGPLVPAALADADVSVCYVRPICLSYRFSLPNKLFESIHAGLPVVAADLPDTTTIVTRYGVGEVFDTERPAELAHAIERVLADPQGYRDASRAAADGLDWSNEAQRLLALYAKVLGASR